MSCQVSGLFVAGMNGNDVANTRVLVVRKRNAAAERQRRECVMNNGGDPPPWRSALRYLRAARNKGKSAQRASPLVLLRRAKSVHYCTIHFRLRILISTYVRTYTFYCKEPSRKKF